MKKEKTILFDLDGTLIDSTDAILESFYYAFKKNNFVFKGTKEDITKEIGYPLDVMFHTLGVPKDIVWDFVDSYKENYKNIANEKTTLLPNAVEAVKLASSFARLAIVTTKTTQYSKVLLEKLELLHYFETMIGRQEVVNPKPHPEPIFKALEELNLKVSENIYMIGDTKLDLIAANEAKISSIAVLCGYGEKEELSTFTEHIVNDSLEAVKSIQKM
ncbi:MAG: HAD family hydrolase [Campylobacterota bacterium]|nr:HAD family hydrolase [Campylobacterota bacterium]